MNPYLTSSIADVTITATSHQLASEHYETYSHAIKYPQAIGPALVLIVSFVGSMFDGSDYYFYANQALSLMCLLTVAIDQYFGWSKKSVTHANVAAQYFQLRDRLARLKRQQQLKLQTTEVIQPAVEKIEENYMALLVKHRRPPSSFHQHALEVIKSTQVLVEAIEKRRLSDSKSNPQNIKSRELTSGTATPIQRTTRLTIAPPTTPVPAPVSNSCLVTLPPANT